MSGDTGRSLRDEAIADLSGLREGSFQPEPSLLFLSPTAHSVASGYAELLAREPWHWFTTLTFSPTKAITDKWTGERKHVDRFHPIRGMHLEAADKAFRYFVNSINVRLYGPKWRRQHDHGGIVWARGQEFHKSGKVHFHALLAAPDGDLNKLASRYHWHEFWFREFGRNQIERPVDQEDVVGYVSKYVAKDGEVDFSANFGKVSPPRLFDGVQDRTAGILIKPALVNGQSIGSGKKTETPPGASLSLTHEARPQFGFTEETFFHLPEADQ